MKLVLIASCLLALSACSTKPIVQQQTMLVEIPSVLLTPLPIKAVEEETVGGLAEAYIDNTLYLGLANRRLERIKQWQERQRDIYERQQHKNPN